MIRPATPADAPAVMGLINHVVRYTTITFNPVEKTLDEVVTLCAGDMLVLEQDGVVVGYASYFPFRVGQGYRFTVEHSIVLDVSAHGTGQGRALLGALMDRARAAGLHAMIAGCSGENSGAIAFHKKCGFSELAILPEVGHKFGRWLDLVLLQKRL